METIDEYVSLSLPLFPPSERWIRDLAHDDRDPLPTADLFPSFSPTFYSFILVHLCQDVGHGQVHVRSERQFGGEGGAFGNVGELLVGWLIGGGGGMMGNTRAG